MKKAVVAIILIISLIIINNLARSIYNLWQKQELVVTTEKELEQQKKLHERLKEQAAAVKDPNYVEKVARDKLFLAKPKEQIVILPGQASSDKQNTQKAKKVVQIPNWKAWLQIFSFPVPD